MTANTSPVVKSRRIPWRLRVPGLWPAAAGFTALVEFAAIGPEQAPSQEHAVADTGQDTVAPGNSDPSGGLMYERELFAYTPRQRDPFLPPDGSGGTGALLEGIRLLGIIHHDRTSLSVVLLGNVRTVVDQRDSRAGDARRPQTVRLRPGQTIGHMRLARIHSHHVVLEAATPTGVVRRMLRIPQASERNPS